MTESILLFVVVALVTVSTLITVGKVGSAPEPRTASNAVGAVVLNGFIIVVCVIAGLALLLWPGPGTT